MIRISDQLEIFGFEETRRRVAGEGETLREKSRLARRVELAHELLSELPAVEDLSFLHSGLCQTCLPHSRPADNSVVWERTSGRFSLTVTPGVFKDGDRGSSYVGVPYGSKARLIMFHLQTEGLKSRTVSLGPSLSAFLRSLGLPVSGGPRGSINAIREQSLRIARCSFTMQWTGTQRDGSERTIVSDSKIVDGLELWRSATGEEWAGTVELSERFHRHLREHAVPLDKRGIAHLSGNSLGLDLYALFAYRLPRLTRETHLRWSHLQAQVGSSERTTNTLAQRVREVISDVLVAYPHANVEVTSHGIIAEAVKACSPKNKRTGISTG